MAVMQQVGYEKAQKQYNFDVKPKVGRADRKMAKASAKDKSRLLMLVATVGLICIGMIIVAAYCASVNYNNNLLRDENSALLGEVESLQIEIQKENNIAEIEKKATTKLGMVYPEGEQFVLVEDQKEPDSGFTGQLKKKAFN